MGVISNWKSDQLKVIMKGKNGQGGKGGKKPGNVEITQEDIEDILDSMSDDHKPGEEQGEKAQVDGDVTEADIDQTGKKIDEEVEKGGKKGQGEDVGDDDAGESKFDPNAKSNGQPGGKGKITNSNINPNKVQPKFNWKTLIQRFIMSHKPKNEETYAKPSPKGVTGAHVAAQIGAAAIKPGEKPHDDEVDIKIAFVVDSSGSMSNIIQTVMSNAIALLKQPMFKKAAVTMVKFSGNHTMHKVIFAQNKAALVTDPLEKPKKFDLNAQKAVFSVHYGAGTVFDVALREKVSKMLAAGYNVIFFSDSDIIHGENWTNFQALFKVKAQQLFLILASQHDYNAFRQKAGTATANITYFK